jgi:hypothetical protein
MPLFSTSSGVGASGGDRVALEWCRQASKGGAAYRIGGWCETVQKHLDEWMLLQRDAIGRKTF